MERLNNTVQTQKKQIEELKTANQQLERLRIEHMKKQAATSAAAKNTAAQVRFDHICLMTVSYNLMSIFIHVLSR